MYDQRHGLTEIAGLDIDGLDSGGLDNDGQILGNWL